MIVADAYIVADQEQKELEMQITETIKNIVTILFKDLKDNGMKPCYQTLRIGIDVREAVLPCYLIIGKIDQAYTAERKKDTWELKAKIEAMIGGADDEQARAERGE